MELQPLHPHAHVASPLLTCSQSSLASASVAVILSSPIIHKLILKESLTIFR